jgi:hypothetical protein
LLINSLPTDFKRFAFILLIFVSKNKTNMKTIMHNAFSFVKKTAVIMLAVMATITAASAKVSDTTTYEDGENASVSCLKLDKARFTLM